MENPSESVKDISGQTLSHYRIVKRLGAGGMGVVYMAQDVQLDRTVAIKILPEEVSSDSERMRRFVREARAASSTDHPNIVHMYEIGEERGVHFIAMQYIDGTDLRERISGRPLPVQQLLDASIQIVDALSEAHSRGIIHRDLKPANVMITPKGHVKLLDFGLARMGDSKGAEADSQIATESMTAAGLVMGTVAYMSPEQSLGNRVDHRTDIFSLGVLLYEMATGRLPFIGRTPTETIDKIVHGQPESVSRLNYDTPHELERIIRKCMEKDPQRRYQSATEVLIDLKNLKRDLDSATHSTGTRSPQTASMTAGPRVRHRLIIVAAVLVLSALAVFLILRKPAGNQQAIQSLAVLPFENVNLDSESEYLSDGITDSIISNLSRLKQLRVMSRGTVFIYKGKKVDPRQVGNDLGVEGVVSGKLLQQGKSLVVSVDLVDTRDGRQIWGEEYNRISEDLLTLQSDISRTISEKLRLKITGEDEVLVSKQYTRDPKAYELFLQGQYRLSSRKSGGVSEAIGFFQQAIQRDPGYALAYDGLANAYTFLGISGALLGGLPPKQVMPKAKEAVLKAMELDDALPDPHSSFGHILWNYDWDWKGAEKQYIRALELNPYDQTACFRYSFFLLAQGRSEDAHRMIQKFKEYASQSDPSTHLVLGLFHYWSRDYDSAIPEYRAALQPGHAPLISFRLGLSLMEKGLYEEALKALEDSVKISQRAPVALIGLGICQARMGKMQEAEKILSELLQRSNEIYLPEFYMACLYGNMGRIDESFFWLEQGYKEHANSMALLRVYPLVDPLRSDPRFLELLRRMNLQ